MRQVIIAHAAAAGNSAAVPLDIYLTPFQVTVSTVVVGTIAYSIEYTYDNPFTVAAADIVWRTDSGIPVGTAGNGETTFDNPIAAVRINQASGTGSVTATITQAGAR